jgi:CheY-like chemotaxis protein/nitrogen-specific signal transduction histidine kinase
MPSRKPRKSATTRTRRTARRLTPRRSGPTRGAQDTALAALAHEIRTSLTGILALSELLATAELAATERRWATTIKSTAEYLAALTTLMVDAAKADAARLVLRREPFDPRVLARAVADLFVVRAETKGLRSEIAVADDLPEAVIGDPLRLRAAIENLVDNAVKFTDSGSVSLAVTATAAARGRVRLDVVVTDSGIGMTRADIARLFRPFAQASDDVARRYGGSGLGLAFVKRLAKAMGGDLTVTSVPGHGSTFRLFVILDRQKVDAAAIAAGEGPARSLRVLCVEDNAFGRVVLNTILTGLGHRADYVGTGEAAVEAAAAGSYDAVIMDVMLAGIDGLEATRRIRALPAPAGRVPIIGMSGRGEPADVEAARAAGMNDYLMKPVSPSVLAGALTKALVDGESG